MIILLGFLVLFWLLILNFLADQWFPYRGLVCWSWLILPPFIVAQIWFY